MLVLEFGPDSFSFVILWRRSYRDVFWNLIKSGGWKSQSSGDEIRNSKNKNMKYES